MTNNSYPVAPVGYGEPTLYVEDGTKRSTTLGGSAINTLSSGGGGGSPSGTLSATEAKDVFTATGTVAIFGTLSATEGADLAVIVGSGFTPPSGAMAATEAPDVFSAIGSSSRKRRTFFVT